MELCFNRDVSLWPLADVTTVLIHVRFRGVERTSGQARRMSAYDPGCVKTRCCCYDSPVILWGELMGRFVEEADRGQWSLLPECLDDFINEDNPVRVIHVFVAAFELAARRCEGGG